MAKRIRKTAALFVLLALMAAAAMAVRGVVKTTTGTPVEQARVDIAGSLVHTFTDASGKFELEDCPRPCTLVISHPRFHEAVAEPRGDGTELMAIVLEHKNTFSDQVVVTASRTSGDTFAPESIASTVVDVEQSVLAPATLTEVIEGVPGVSENGQGGHFQVYSIRGISRQRVMTLVSGMRMTSERRAGVATSFLDPQLMGTVEVVRGPSSTFYGSGALGGVVQIFPRRFDGPSVELGYNSQGDENAQVLGWGNETWSFGLARRDAANDTTAAGKEQFYQFSQWSATLAGQFERGARQWEVLVVPARGTDIGKPNREFPNVRPVLYPEENHLLVRVAMTGEAGWNFQAWAHPHDLQTRTTRVGESLSLLDTETLDLGGNLQRRWKLGRVAGNAGVEYFGRRGVSSAERIEAFADGSVTRIEALDNAQEDEIGLYGSARWRWHSTSLQAGGRYTFERQSNAAFPSREDGTLSGFMGLVQPLGGGFELVANLGSGLRFPSLSERFFSGSTPRGGQIGNPGLSPERSLSFDTGLRWFGGRMVIEGGVFRQEIDDYIERIRIGGNVRTFVNLTQGTIQGLELEAMYRPSARWQVSWGGHLIDGESDDGTPLADIPPARLDLGLRWSAGRWQARSELEYRAAKNDPGDGELAIGSALLVAGSLAYSLGDGLSLVLRGRNLTDRVYFNSADDLAAVAPGRSLGLAFSWKPPG